MKRLEEFEAVLLAGDAGSADPEASASRQMDKSGVSGMLGREGFPSKASIAFTGWRSKAMLYLVVGWRRAEERGYERPRGREGESPSFLHRGADSVIEGRK